MRAKILLAHSHYDSSVPSGELRVLQIERELLQRKGHTTTEIFRFSDEIRKQGAWGAVKGALSTPWNPFSARAMRQAVDAFLPDVVHVHNTFPLLSPAIFHSVGSRAARVLTLHNYRLFCSAAIPMRAGKVCTECIERQTVWPALMHGCYRNSRWATIPLALGVALHRNLGTWTHRVDAFIALTEFQRTLMIEAGLPAELVHVKPNFYPGEPAVLPWEERRPGVVFAGRLSAEKGVESLVRAWLMWGPSAPELRILGDGELHEGLVKLAATQPGVPIRFSGQLTGATAQEEIGRSRLLVLPSQCLEGFPMVVREAFAFGTPVAAADTGPLPSIICHEENGLIFSSGNPQSLLEIVKGAWESQGKLERLAVGARRSFESLYTEEVNYQLLVEIYQQAMEVSRKRKAS